MSTSYQKNPPKLIDTVLEPKCSEDMASDVSTEDRNMAERFVTRTVPKKQKSMPPYFETVIYDLRTHLAAMGTGDTQEESEAEAAKQLAILNSRQERCSEDPTQYLPWRY
jgi:hypothetical protein